MSETAEPRRRSFRPGLLESLVAFSILVSLSGLVMPIVGTEVAESRRTEAAAGVQAIAEGLDRYSQDTLFLPTGALGRTNLAWLYGPGEMPTENPFVDGGEARPLSDILLSNVLGGPGWDGPYLAELQSDPWGRAYLVNVDGWLRAREHALVVSAGPDGVVDTSPFDTSPGGDDIIFVLD